MTRAGAISLAMCAFAASAGVAAASELRITGIRHWSLGEVTRVAIETNGEFRYRSDRLVNPERIFFDLVGTRPATRSQKIRVSEIGDRLLKRIRMAETQPGITRIVLDLEPGVEYAASQLANPDRLIIQLSAAGAPSVSPLLVSDRFPGSGRPRIFVPPTFRVSTQWLDAAPVLIAEMPELDPAARLLASVRPPVSLPGRPKSRTRLAAKRVTSPPLRRPELQDTDDAMPDMVIAPPTAADRARAARHTTAGGSSLVRALGLKVTRVVIDPGHGGHDQGTVGPHGLMEKELVLDVSKRLGKLIEERMSAEVIYTRSDDTFVPLETRTQIANLKKADLFLSIHANSSPEPRVAGVETYYLNFTSSEDALDLASRENASSHKSVYELRDLIQKITMHDKIEESKEFAGQVQTAMHGFAVKTNPGIRNRGIRKAPFVVLIGASMPSVLAEVGFISNPREEAMFKKPDQRQRLAEALFRGVARYSQTLSHFQVAQAVE
jgi:N-acetylmuramoyl-L-alanine amidase